MSRAYLALAVALVAVGIGAASQAPLPGSSGQPAMFGFPTHEDEWLTMNLTGLAINRTTGDSIQVAIDLWGPVERTWPVGEQGAGVSEDGTLLAHVRVINARSETPLQGYDTQVRYHADRATFQGQAMDAFVFQASSFDPQDALQFSLHGASSTGQVQDGQAQFATTGHGMASLQGMQDRFVLNALGHGTEQRIGGA